MSVRGFLDSALRIWGALTLLGAIALVVVIAYQFGPGQATKIDSATPHDVRYVLNWCGLGDDRIESVVHSHVSGRSFTGDHMDAFAIKISRLEMNELTNTKDVLSDSWYRGDKLPPVVNDAFEFMGPWLAEVEWFPKLESLRTADYYIYPWSIYFRGTQPTSAELIFVRPSDKMVFFFGGKT